jgi:aerotaxis receptor
MSAADRVLISQTDLIVSETDLKGVIRYVNDDFCRIAGFERGELIGKPHSIVRHQDMPKAAFEDLWSTLKKGHIWKGFVKNRTKSGGHYWVYATAFFINSVHGEGYLSVRRRAHEDEIARYEQLYAQMVQQQKGQS